MLSLIGWFSGGANQYMPLTHCMRGDWLWIALVVLGDIAIFAGYQVIAYTWYRLEVAATDSATRTAMRLLRLIFLYCSLTYLWSAIDVVWPGWRLFAIAKLFLAFYVWRYTTSVDGIAVIYKRAKVVGGSSGG